MMMRVPIPMYMSASLPVASESTPTRHDACARTQASSAAQARLEPGRRGVKPSSARARAMSAPVCAHVAGLALLAAHVERPARDRREHLERRG